MIRPRAAVLLLFALGACAPGCKNAIARRVAAPDGSLDAVVYHRDCGRGDGASTEVALLPHGAELPDLPTNVLTLSDSVAVQASWHAQDSLLLSYPAEAKVVSRLPRSPDGVSVAFTTR